MRFLFTFHADSAKIFNMQPLTTSIYTFSDLIETNCLYVDKTRHLHKLVTAPKGQYFLARPRRFGKSLLISTFKAIFQGRRELFTGLAIDKLDYDWKSYPIIHLDMGSCAAESTEELECALLYIVNSNAKEHNIELTQKSFSLRFLELTEKVAERDGKVVILVDEYDKPLLNRIGQPNVSEFQQILKRFYSVIKTTEAHQRFVLLTGVSKFTHVSIFSDLNNLTDITMVADCATLLGYTQEELEENFDDYIIRLAQKNSLTKNQSLTELRERYNGYRFHQDAATVYNPVSVMSCFQTAEFKNYWFATGTPSFLINLLKKKPLKLDDLSAPETSFSEYDPANLSPLPLLMQTGYLTIAGIEQLGRKRYYKLVIPNFEIEESLSMWLAAGFCERQLEDIGSTLDDICKALLRDDIDAVLEHTKVFFAGVPNRITLKHEKYYQTIFFVIFKMINSAFESEVSTNTGYVDAVIKTDSTIYVIEFKLHDTAKAALKQINDKQYALRYQDDGRKVVKVGVKFDEELRNITDWICE